MKNKAKALVLSAALLSSTANAIDLSGTSFLSMLSRKIRQRLSSLSFSSSTVVPLMSGLCK